MIQKIIYTVDFENLNLHISEKHIIPNSWSLTELGFNEEEDLTGDKEEDKQIIKEFLEGKDLPDEDNRLPYFNEYDEYRIDFI